MARGSLQSVGNNGNGRSLDEAKAIGAGLYCKMTFYRLRPGVRHPVFRADDLYRLIEPTYPEG